MTYRQGKKILIGENVSTKMASELLGRSGLQLPRVPSLNTDRVKILTERTLPAIGVCSMKRAGWVKLLLGESKPHIGWIAKIGKSDGFDRLCPDGVIICQMPLDVAHVRRLRQRFARNGVPKTKPGNKPGNKMTLGIEKASIHGGFKRLFDSDNRHHCII